MPTKRIITGLSSRNFGNYPDTSLTDHPYLKNGRDIRLEYAKILVSLWSYACMADGAFHDKEGNLVGEMVKALFESGSILADYQETRSEIIEVLSDTFDNPLPMKTICKVVEGNDQYALNFYEDAVCIVSADGKLKKDERSFLDELALEFQLSNMDKHQVEKRYDLV
ncbi:tellurite resistance TerB family protein [Leptospira sp. GIMC2001]|uniref:tellurite resistance TerB family protein n=1 Tax=Leptospira sp. GIMC2001 TaxID=1513297 RepID=UPI00234B4AC4|nr:TerB family tellurite resistance protein [Leptospira sp. GIMC2001]WCL49064.1 TerB family tellurite resistance protein [Leptospira sp. GIMC2001]